MKFPVVDGLRTLELGSKGEMREWLNGLVLSGKKQATAGLLKDYDEEPYETPGEQLVLVDDDMRRVGAIEVTRTEFCTFGEVPWSFAVAENEGDTSIEQWRAGHRRFWESEGVEVVDELPLLLVYFRLVSSS